MNPTLRAVALAALLAPLAACGTTTWDRQALENTAPTGTEFTRQLALEYLAYAKFEEGQFDWLDASYFARKGRQAAAGEVVMPEDPDQWGRIAEGVRPELRTARSRLITVLDGNARTTQPARAAEAQSFYDCWVEQQQEGWQTTHIARCRDGFYRLMGELEARPVASTAPAPAPMAAPAPAQAATAQAYVVFFPFDRAEVTPVAAAVLDRAADDFRRTGQTRIRIEGFTDTSGTDAYNQGLSERRARAVARYLAGKGVTGGALATQGFGETRLRVATPDGVRNDENRRAEITFSR
jgi:OOP family OmpA-OmpF porin